ncbi:MAG: hypothetical protein ACTSP4_15585 [Candidatus Hodarchaeales archaeon]
MVSDRNVYGNEFEKKYRLNTTDGIASVFQIIDYTSSTFITIPDTTSATGYELFDQEPLYPYLPVEEDLDESELELNEETIEAIKKAREDVKNGKTFTLSELKERLDL